MSVRTFVDAAERGVDALHGMVLMQRGEVVAEGYWHPYRKDEPHRLFSLSKSFTSTAVGFAVAEGLVGLDDPVADHFGGRGDPRLLVRHLLSMTTGHVEDTAPRMSAGDDWVDGFLGLPVEREPGTHFVYNSGATYVAGAIVQRATGLRLVEYLRPRLFDPLGFDEVTWEQCPAGLDVGGWGMAARTSEIARFGQLYLHDEHHILPAGWAELATARHADNFSGDAGIPDWQQGYGLQFWRCRHDAFRGDGAFGQFCVVVPARDLVVALNSGTDDLQAVLDLVWEHLLEDDLEPAPLPGLALPAVQGGQSAPDLEGTYVVERPRDSRPEDWRPSHERPPTIRAITFAAGRVTIEDETGVHEHDCRPGQWRRAGRTAATGGWTGPAEYTFRIAYTDGPFVRTYRCRFSAGTLRIDASDNVSFGPTGYAPILAVAAAHRL